MIRKLYPYGKKKAFNVTYDDGVLQDVPFVKILNKYNLKGTFNLNSSLMENEFEWTHESGLVVKRLRREDVVHLYDGHEIASHTATHPYMDNLTKEEILRELSDDKKNLEELFSREIKGFAVPFEYYSELIEECVKECGFEYGRISEESKSFEPQCDFYNWKSTVFHLDDGLEDLTRKFIDTDEELAFFQIIGHTYDLETENMWDVVEDIFKKISNQSDILPMTTIEIVDYLKAMEKAEITEAFIKNNSDKSLWFLVENTIFEIKPNIMLELECIEV